MQKLRQWKFILVCLLTCAACGLYPLAAAESPTHAPAGDAIKSAGYIVSVPVRGWLTFGMERTTETIGYLMVPEVLDEKGTVTLTLNANESISQLAIRKADVPGELHFLFDNSEELYVNVRRQIVTYPGAPANITVDLPYDKSSPPILEQKYRLLDAAGNVPEVQIKAHYHSPYSPGTAGIDVKTDANGLFSVPRVQGLPDITQVPQFARRLPQVQLGIKHLSSDQQFEVSFAERITTDPVVVLLPVADPDAAATSITRISGKIINADGSPASGATIRLPEFRYPGTEEFVDDVTTIAVMSAYPRPDGTFDLAVNPQFEFLSRYSSSIPVTVMEPVDGLFQRLSLQVNPGAENFMQFPNRLSVTAALFSDSGQPVSLVTPAAPNTVIRLEVQKVDAGGKVLDTDYININTNETTDSLFLLQNLPVPGRYLVNRDSVPYGPVDLSETSPTDIVRFNQLAGLGVRRGLVHDENGKPLAGAMVVLSKDYVQDHELQTLSSLVEEINTVDKAAGLDRLTSAVASVVDYALTTGSGEYIFPRTIPGHEGVTYLAAVAPLRVGATLYDITNERQMLPTKSYDLPPVRLPRTIMATGVVHAPAQIPDPDNLGQLKPMPDGQNYRVYWWDTRGWFNPQGDMRWQYGAPSREFAFEMPFEYPVPLGTSFTLGAIPADDDIHLSLQLWKEGPATPGDEPLQLEPATLRAVQPFWLELKYQNGQPAAGVNISSLYGTRNRVVNGRVIQPQTDENGRYLLYGDEGLAPQLNVYGQPGMGFRQQMFRIQPLDMSTPVPTLTLTLDPKIWGHDGRNAR